MRCLIASDIHGNIEALDAVLDDASAVGHDVALCLGDIVGYGANPRETIATVRDVFDAVVQGNHDAAVVGQTESGRFNEYARAAVQWTRDQLSDEDVEYLRELPLRTLAEGICLVHASPDAPGDWRYVTDTMGASYQFEAFEEQLCLIGHTHVPLVVSLEGATLRSRTGPTIRLRPSGRYLINVGSVGQPRDGNPDAAYGMLDLDAGVLELRRVAYSVKKASRKIEKAGLPAFLAERLLEGV